MHHRAILLAVGVYTAQGFGVGRPLNQGKLFALRPDLAATSNTLTHYQTISPRLRHRIVSAPRLSFAEPQRLGLPRFSRRGGATALWASSAEAEPEHAGDGEVEKAASSAASSTATPTVELVKLPVEAAVARSVLAQQLNFFAYPFVAYFRYMRSLWRPEVC